MERVRPGAIYVVRSASGPVKIGVSASPRRRLTQLRTASAAVLTMDYCADVEGDLKEIEERAHARLEARRLSGEWFDVSVTAAVRAVLRSADELGFVLVPRRLHTLPRIAKVRVTGPATLRVAWRNGGASTINLAGWIGRGNPHIVPLADPEVFARAAIAGHGSLVTWDDDQGELAIDSEHLRLIAEEQAPFGAADAAAWQAELKISNSEAADLLGVVLSTWSAYKAEGNVPATVARLCRAMRRDPVLLHAHLRPRTPGPPKSVA